MGRLERREITQLQEKCFDQIMFVMFLLLLGVGLCTGAKVEMEGEGCDDGYLDCSHRAELCRSENYNELLQMMTHCRQTCRHFFENKVGRWVVLGLAYKL